MMQKERKMIRWGILGCGDVTERKSGPPYQQTEGFTLQAVMRRDLEKAKDYAQRHGVAQFYNDADTLINDDSIDAIYIATPPDSHFNYALKVAQAGKPCCIEKPMANSYQECVEIQQAFEQQKIPLFIAYYRRTLPRFVQVKNWIDSGSIGVLRHVNLILNKAPSALDISGALNWRTDQTVAPGGYFDDLASHGLDLIHFILGEVVDAFGVSDNQQGLYTSIDAVSASWIHSSGATGAGCWNFGSFGAEDRVEIYGSKGKVSFSVFQEAPIVLETDKGREEMMIDHPKHVQGPHIEAMRKDLFDPSYQHPSIGKTAVHTAWIMDKILGRI